jgi:hypothetical protein
MRVRGSNVERETRPRVASTYGSPLPNCALVLKGSRFAECLQRAQRDGGKEFPLFHLRSFSARSGIDTHLVRATLASVMSWASEEKCLRSSASVEEGGSPLTITRLIVSSRKKWGEK